MAAATLLGPARCLRAGTRLIRQSATARSLYLIESGLVKLSGVDSEGRSVAMLIRFPGDLVGIYGTLLGVPHLVSATALTVCHLRETSAEHALQVFRSHPEAGCFLAQRQSVDAVRLNLLLMESRFLTAEQRFYRLLLQIIPFTGVTPSSRSFVSVQVPLSEADIADLVAMNRSAFSRLKRSLIRSGHLKQHANVFSFSRDQLSTGT